MKIAIKVQQLAEQIALMTTLVGRKPDYILMSTPDYHEYVHELSDEDINKETGHGTIDLMQIPVICIGFNIEPSVVYES